MSEVLPQPEITPRRPGPAGWGARIRTWEWRNQNRMLYVLLQLLSLWVANQLVFVSKSGEVSNDGSRAGRHFLPIAPTLCLQSVSRHRAVPQDAGSLGP